MRFPRRLTGGAREDRLSDLPDDIIGHILSFLPTEEAPRAAVLSRRWRYIFASVHTISFEDEMSPLPGDSWTTFYFDSEERRSRNGDFLDTVNNALLCRRRCSSLTAPATPLRVFRVALRGYHLWDKPMVDQWVAHALQQSREELHLDLRLHPGVVCKCSPAPGHVDSDDDPDEEANTAGLSPPEWYNRLPRRLYTCAALRSLRLGYCSLKPPEAISLPSVETLHLTGIHQTGVTIQRLISGCPRLVDLTLEGCSNLQRVSVLDRRLRRLSLRCCRNLVSVTIDASELATLNYRGTVPEETLLTLQGSPRISSVTIDFCGPPISGKKKIAALQKLLGKFADARYLHLGSSRLGCSIESEFFVGLPTFFTVRHLELTGCPDSCSIVLAVTRILQQTPNLEVISLFLVPVNSDQNGTVTVPDDAMDISVQCLLHRLREINLVHYDGNKAQRRMAKVLLGNAVALQKMCVVFPKGPFTLHTRLTNEIKGWVVNKSAKIMFL